MIKPNVNHLGKDIFAYISEKAKEFNAINATQPDIDFGQPVALLKEGSKAIAAGNSSYCEPNGLPGLREIIASFTESRYGITFQPKTEVTITSGAIQAVFTSLSALIEEGDEVIVFEPAYTNYTPAIEKNGGKAIYVQLKAPDFSVDWEKVQKLINTRTRIIVVNIPHNPTGSVFSAEDFKQLKKIIQGTKIVLVGDESFENLVYSPHPYSSLVQDPVLAERSIVVRSLGKLFNVPGWRLGYCLAPEKLSRQFRKYHIFQVNSSASPLQVAMYEFLKGFREEESLRQSYQEAKDFLSGILKSTSYKPIDVSGGYFQLVDFSEVSEEKEQVFTLRLLEEANLAVFPLSAFYHDAVDNHLMGINFAKSEKNLTAIVERLKKLCE